MLENNLVSGPVAVYGAGAMGSYIVDYLFRFKVRKVLVSDVNQPVAEQVAANYQSIGLDCESCSNQTEMTRRAKAHILAVSLRDIGAVVDSILPGIKQGDLVVQTCTIQEPVFNDLKIRIPSECGIIGFHNWNDNSVKMEDQYLTLIFEKSPRSSTLDWIPDMAEFAASTKAWLSTMTPAQHDFAGAKQTLFHILGESISHTLSDKKTTGAEQSYLLPLLDSALFDVIARTLKTKEEVMETIFKNGNSRDMINTFWNSSHDIYEAAIKKLDWKSLDNRIEECIEFLGAERVMEGTGRMVDYIRKHHPVKVGKDHPAMSRPLKAVSLIMALVGAESLKSYYKSFSNVKPIPYSARLMLDFMYHTLIRSRGKSQQIFNNEEARHMTNKYVAVALELQNLAVERYSLREDGTKYRIKTDISGKQISSIDLSDDERSLEDKARRIMQDSREHFGMNRILEAAGRTSNYFGKRHVPLYARKAA